MLFIIIPLIDGINIKLGLDYSKCNKKTVQEVIIYDCLFISSTRNLQLFVVAS